MLARVLGLLALITLTLPAAAHEVRPAFLQIREVEPSTYDVLWKTPAQGDLRLALNVILPSECRGLGTPRATLVNAAAIEHQRTICAGGLASKQIAFENLASTLTDVIVRFEPIDGSPSMLRVNGAAPLVVIPSQQSMSEIAWSYVWFGVEHILLGFDHLLFVLCLLMLVGDFKRLLGAITAFTVAHSITLAGTTFGWLRLASAPVEACIALSIAFIAAEIIKTRVGRASMTQRLPWIAAFGFGLLHGFGFASALRDIGLPDDAVPLALLSFNVGVEAGQILFVAVVLAVVFLWRRYMPRPPAWAWRAPPYIAGIAASFWFIERTVQIVL
ncbi:MAG TPA: HupE/UreJ family protein [Steroidobacter sp.]|uniref:HupE/UreJ family protein n=1 Tax=Steroidobacter sp. TaxID=1978227 RepID=UPI002ED9CDB8